MSNGIGRKRTMGISVEGTYGTPVSAPTFVLPLQDTPRIEVVQSKARNISALGSSYQADSLINTVRYANVSLNVKVDEDTLPLFFKQKFTISSSTVSGETTVYQHTLSYSNSNQGASFTLWLDDDDRTSQQVAGVVFSNINVVAEPSGLLRLEITGMGKFPTTWAGSNTVTQPREFVGRNAVFSYGDYSGALASYNLLKGSFNHTFGLSGEDVNFALGEDDLVGLYTLEDEFMAEIQALFPNLDDRDDYANNTKKKWAVAVTDSSRYVTGSVTNVSPSILLNYPVGYVEQWSEEGGLGDVLKQNLTLLPTDEVGVANAPMNIVVVNGTASY